MKALRLILFGVFAALFALFAFNNWTAVDFHRPDGVVVKVALPIIVAVAFVLGWLPMLLLHWAARAQWRRRLVKSDRMLADALSTGPKGTAPVGGAGPAFGAGAVVPAHPVVPPEGR